MSEHHGTDTFSHRAGYHTDPLAVAIKQARKGGTLAAGEGALLVAEIDRLERILAALREPSEAVVDAFRKAYTRCESENDLAFTHIMGLSHAIRAAVAAAEQEVGA